MEVIRALLYLRLTSLRNLVAGRLRRLRQPKYAAGGVAAALYFWFFFFRRRGPGNAGMVFATLFGAGRAEWIAAGLLTLFALLVWATTSDQPGLAFTEAEVAFLFPAPLARRQLIHYKLANAVLMALFGSVFFTLLSGAVQAGPAVVLRTLLTWWVFNLNLSLHQMAAALTMARLSAAGLRARRRRIIVYTSAAGFAIVLMVVAVQFGSTAVAWLLWPARVVVRPFQAETLADFYLAILPAIALVIVHYVWVHAMETPFEEASVARAQKLGEMVARIRAGRAVAFSGSAKARRAPFPLTDRLPPEFAFLWKNLMAAPSYLNRQAFLVAALLILAVLTWLKRRPDLAGPGIAGHAALISLALLAYLMIIGPQLARNDLRGDINRADVLKTYPLPGWRIVLGSLLAPTVILTAIAWLLLLVAVIGLKTDLPVPWLTPQFKIVAGLVLATVVPALCAVQLIVPNAAALIFPAWAQSGRNPAGGGFDVMGQRLIFFAGQLVCLALALVPAVLLAWGTLFFTGENGVPAALLALVALPLPVFFASGINAGGACALAALPVLAVFVGEVALGVWLLGPRFEHLDISAELRS